MTAAKPLTDHGEGAAAEKHGQCEEEVQLRVLYYELQDTVLVFMQPQFIVDAIKYVIRESSADNVNDEIREMDACIRRRSDDGGAALDRFLGCGEGHGSGVLPRQLLTPLLFRQSYRQLTAAGNHNSLDIGLIHFKFCAPASSP